MQLIKVSPIILYFADDKSMVEKIKYSIKDHTAEKVKFTEPVFLITTFSCLSMHINVVCLCVFMMYINI